MARVERFARNLGRACVVHAPLKVIGNWNPEWESITTSGASQVVGGAHMSDEAAVMAVEQRGPATSISTVLVDYVTI